jgi:hypothetical protein
VERDKGNATLADQYEAESRQLQQSVLAAEQGQPQQAEPILISQSDEKRIIDSMVQKIRAFRAQTGREPTPDELVALETQQTPQPQQPR